MAKTEGGEWLMRRLTPSVDALALMFCHEPPDRVERALEDMRAGVAKDMAAILSPQKAEVFAAHWIAIIRIRIAEVSAVQPGVA